MLLHNTSKAEFASDLRKLLPTRLMVLVCLLLGLATSYFGAVAVSVFGWPHSNMIAGINLEETDLFREKFRKEQQNLSGWRNSQVAVIAVRNDLFSPFAQTTWVDSFVAYYENEEQRQRLVGFWRVGNESVPSTAEAGLPSWMETVLGEQYGDYPAVSLYEQRFGFPYQCVGAQHVSGFDRPLRGIYIPPLSASDPQYIFRNQAWMRDVGPYYRTSRYLIVARLAVWPTVLYPKEFALNWLFWSPAWFFIIRVGKWLMRLPLRVYRRFSRSRRRKHSLCIQCCYDLSATPTDSPCPECGFVDEDRTAQV